MIQNPVCLAGFSNFCSSFGYFKGILVTKNLLWLHSNFATFWQLLRTGFEPVSFKSPNTKINFVLLLKKFGSCSLKLSSCTVVYSKTRLGRRVYFYSLLLVSWQIVNQIDSCSFNPSQNKLLSLTQSHRLLLNEQAVMREHELDQRSFFVKVGSLT